MTQKKYSIKNDPNRSQEAEKYQNPIPSREVILRFLSDLKYPTVFENIAEALSLRKSSALDALGNRLNAMVRDGQLKQNARYFSLYKERPKIITGAVRVQNDGTSIIATKDKKHTAFLSPSQTRLIFDGDIVSASILGLNKKNKLEAKIDSIVKRNTKSIVGRYGYSLDTHFIQPISKTLPKHILLTEPDELIEPNTLIEANIIIQPSYFAPAVATFSEMIEEQSPVLTAISIASKKHNLIEDWSKKTLKMVDKLPTSVLAKEIVKRTDLRHLPFVTIDGEDAKDFDDAVYAHKNAKGAWKLYVAIADVSYYVHSNSAIDHEAQNRSTSVYFPDYVIPMLPEALSNELCSLKPNVDRLALICEMNISKQAKLSRYKFYSGVINSKARLTYTEVGKLLEDQKNQISKDYPALVPDLLTLYELYQTLAIARKKRGAIDFDKVETEIILDQDRHIASIVPRHRNDAHRLIEECMLLANSAAAKFINKNKANAPFRVHEAPTEAKVEDLKAYLKTVGLKFKTHKTGVTSIDYANVLDQAKHREDFDNIQLMVLKSMNQAVYTPYNNGHFGLAYDAYVHFTSPIRRYPDLITHRTIKALIQEKSLGGCQYTLTQLDELSNHASAQERNADLAALEVEKWLKCHFLENRIGEIFDAKIVHITGFGMFVELCENYIEGLVHIASLQGDYYIFDEIQHQLVGKHSNKSYGIGQTLQVQLVRVDIEGGYIDFELAENSDVNPADTHRKSSSSHYGKRKKKARLRHAKTAENGKKPTNRNKNTAKKKKTKQKPQVK